MNLKTADIVTAACAPTVGTWHQGMTSCWEYGIRLIYFYCYSFPHLEKCTHLLTSCAYQIFSVFVSIKMFCAYSPFFCEIEIINTIIHNITKNSHNCIIHESEV